MKVGVEEVIRMTGTGIVIGIKTESGTDTGNETVTGKGLARGMVEEVGMGGEGWTGSKTITGMEGMEAGTDIVNEMCGWRVMGADYISLLGMVIGQRPEIHLLMDCIDISLNFKVK